jgi:comEA protein
MIGDFGFRPRTLVWLMGIAFTVGLGVRGIQEVRRHEIKYPLTVVENNREAEGLKLRADSIMAERTARENALININTATAADFDRLDGIGPVLSRRMVEYREQHGSYKSVDELDNVSGIGPKRLAAIRERCTVDSTRK